jgi:phosphatidate cytidylyltransferase
MFGCSPTLPWYLIVVAACFGDLIGSAIKRHAGVQDYSQMVPGHGGLMDRWDSLLLVGIINMFGVYANRVL